MRLSIEQRVAAIFLFHKHDLQWQKARFKVLRSLCRKKRIFATVQTLRKIIKRWQQMRTVADLASIRRCIMKTKVSRRMLLRIDKLIRGQRDITAPQIAIRTRLRVSVRTIQRYVTCVLVKLKKRLF